MADRIVADTPFLRCIDRDGWFFAERPSGRDVVVIVAVTPEDGLLLVEQVRPPVAAPVIELPAGLTGDDPRHAGESLAAAARRELIEETGFDAERVEKLGACPTSAGVTSELANVFLATGLRRVGPGGGVGNESIRVHEVPRAALRSWLRARADAGVLVSSQVYAGLYLAGWC